jgi:Skp family chaperone for outer membrane proteins
MLHSSVLSRISAVVVGMLAVAPLIPRTSYGQSDARSDARAKAEAQVKSTASQLAADKDLHAASEGFQKAHELDPSDPKPLFYMGAIAFRQEDWAAAVKSYEAYLQLDPAGDESKIAAEKIEEAKTFQSISESAGTQGSQTRVAVVDLDKVARELGWLTKLHAQMGDYQTQLKSDIQKFEQRYQAEIQQHIKDMIPPGTTEGEKYRLSQNQSQGLTNYIVASKQQVQELGQEANGLYKNYQAEWARHYRDAISPLVRQVAQEHRMNIVLEQNEHLLYADHTMDLTDAVVEAARNAPPVIVDVPMTKLQGPPDIRVDKTLNPSPADSRPQPAPTVPKKPPLPADEP